MYGDKMINNFPNVVVSNFLTSDEILEICLITSQTTNQSFTSSLGHNSWHIRLPDYLVKKFTDKASEIAGEELFLKEYNVSRYENVTSNAGNTYVPMLYPHTDETFKEPRFTLDYQIRSNIDWDIVVDDWKEIKTFKLKDNEIISFSGTHQVHWRPKKIFKDGEFVEMLFMHFGYKKYQDEIDSDYIKKVRDHAAYHKQIWNQTEGPSSNPVSWKNNA